MKITFLKLIFTPLFLYYCHTNNFDIPELSNEKMNMKNIKQNIEREEPFVVRKFEPYLNGQWIGKAISYGCYRKGQAPNSTGPNEEEILEDLNIISRHWNLIRIYGADEDSEKILEVIRKHKFPIKVMLGVWLEDEYGKPKRKEENIKQVLKGISLANEYNEIVASINVGNETQVFWSAHRMDIDTLIHYIRFFRNNTNVPVTTADDYNFWNKPISKSVANEVDFIVVHIYPLWNGQTLENSIDWMNNIFFNEIKELYPEKTIVLGEIGWATEYDETKTGDGQQGSLIKGEVSIQAQEKFLLKLDEWIEKNKVTTFLFEAFDESWKGGGENSSPKEIEKHWGVFYENRTPKESFQNFLNVIEKNVYIEQIR